MRTANTQELRRALSSVDLTGADAATVQLAMEYATQLDRGGDPVKVGPPYLACLEALGLTPRARASITGRKAEVGGGNPLDDLRERRRARIAPTTDLDAPS